MKRVAIFLLLILSVSFISAAELTFDSGINEFKKSETLIARLSGNFLDNVLKENIFFYRGHVRIPLEFDLTKINEEFYIYALLPSPNEPTDYTLSIENTRYYKGSEITDDDLRLNFTISNQTADFSVKPGFINTQKDFSLEVQNLQPFKITISIDDTGIIDSTELKSGEIKKLNFDISSYSETVFKTIVLSSGITSYDIPALIVSNTTTPIITSQENFRFDPSETFVELATSSETSIVVYLESTGQEDIQEVEIFVSESIEPYVIPSIYLIEDFEKNSTVQIELSITSPLEEVHTQGQINARVINLDDKTTSNSYLTLDLDFIPDFIPIGPGNGGIPTGPTTSKTCEEHGGVKCNSEAGETCSEDSIKSKDGFCCIPPGICETEGNGDDPTGKIVGWIILILVAVFLVWFFKKKYGKPGGKVNLLKVARGKKK
ncbi:MAG: hypothetical protein ACE5ES_05345 [Candidatus Nanoarchaeia archaeon]